MKNVIKLIITSNNSLNISDEIGVIKKLEKIDIGYNNITSLPKKIK